MSDKIRYEEIIAKQREELDRLSWRVVLAQTLSGFLLRAYDALQAYGIDYRKLRTYGLWEKLLPQGENFDKPEARPVITKWLQQISNDLDAAIRRKLNISKVIDNSHDEDVP